MGGGAGEGTGRNGGRRCRRGNGADGSAGEGTGAERRFGRCGASGAAAVGTGGAGAVDPLTAAGAPASRPTGRASGAGHRSDARPPGWPTPVAGLPLRCTGSRTGPDRLCNRGRTPDTVRRPKRAAPAELGDIGNPAPCSGVPAVGPRRPVRHRMPRGRRRRTAPAQVAGTGEPGPCCGAPHRDRPTGPTPPHLAPRGDAGERRPPARVADTGSPAPAPPRPAGHPASVPGSRASAPYDGGRDGDDARRWPGSCAGAGGSGGPATGRGGCRISAGGPPVGPCPSWTGGCAPRPGASRRPAPRPCAGRAPRAAVRAAGRRAGR